MYELYFENLSDGHIFTHIVYSPYQLREEIKRRKYSKKLKFIFYRRLQ